MYCTCNYYPTFWCKPKVAEKALAALKLRAAALQEAAPAVEPCEEPEIRDEALASSKDSVEDTLLDPQPPRPIATPARAISSDTQPTEQQIWDAAFNGQLPAQPTNDDNDEDEDDQYMFEVDAESRLIIR